MMTPFPCAPFTSLKITNQIQGHKSNFHFRPAGMLCIIAEIRRHRTTTPDDNTRRQRQRPRQSRIYVPIRQAGAPPHKPRPPPPPPPGGPPPPHTHIHTQRISLHLQQPNARCTRAVLRTTSARGPEHGIMTIPRPKQRSHISGVFTSTVPKRNLTYRCTRRPRDVSARGART